MNLADLYASPNVEDRRAEYPRMPGDNRLTLDQIQQFWANPQTMVPGSWRLDQLTRGYNGLRQMPYMPPLAGFGGLGSGEDIDRAALQARIEAISPQSSKTFLRR